MALRLTGTTLAPTPTTPTAPPAETLSAQARSAVCAGDIETFSTLFAGADEHTDPQRRHQARVAIIDAGLAATAQVSAALAARTFAAVADATLGMLEEEPSEPFLLNLAGVACYELWALDAAQALFTAAKRLDRGLADAERNLSEVGRRRRAARPSRPLHASVPALARRARAVAGRARPAAGQRLSLCMIVRDEEAMLGRCLAAAAPAVDEIVVVDTGSTDRTIEIARAHGARVIEHAWTGSFADARNASFEAATGDWILYLDADEELVADDVASLRALTGQTWREAFYLVETSYTGELGDGQAMVHNALRLFRNRPAYRFTGRLHEQIVHTLPTYNPDRVEQSAIRITHYGYLGSVRAAKEKSARNIELLERQARESAPTPFLEFNLGSEYIVTTDYANAIQHLREAHTMLGRAAITRVEYGAALITRLVMAQRLAGRLLEAGATAAEGLELFPALTDLVLAQGRIAEAQGEAEDAIGLYRRAMKMGDAPAKYGAVVGSGTFMPRLALAELHLNRGEAAPARELLEWCVTHHPEFVLVAAPYLTALLRDGVDPSDAVARLDPLAMPASVRLSIASTLRQAGATSAAEEQYRLGLRGAAGDSAARTAFAELLLGRGAWDEAAEQARMIEAADPFAAQAARIELCATIGRGGATATEAALERAAATELSSAERDVFTAWSAVVAGTGEVPELPVSGAPLLGVLLETLLHAGDGERFVGLLPLLQRSRLAVREQHELLAEMYLAHGLIDRAAQHWLTVCNEQPDARALTGLARIAEQQGMAQDAANFASAALELDPDNELARRVLAGTPAPVAVTA